MSTRSVVARAGKHEGEFAGVYVHSDGYPANRGPVLFHLLREEFHNDLEKMLVYLIDQHPAGWSSIIPEHRSCYCHPQRSKREDFKNRKAEPAQLFTHKNVVKGDTDIEWLWIFDEEKNTLAVRDVRHGEEVLIDLAGAEPDWNKIECGENFERCSHYAWYHNLAPKDCNLSTQAFLGNRTFDFHDAVAFIINGKRYASTGSGGSSEYYSTSLARQHGFKGNYPARTWIASVKARNGKRMDIPVAKVVDGGYSPLPGIAWVFPPTATNPEETVVTDAVLA